MLRSRRKLRRYAGSHHSTGDVGMCCLEIENDSLFEAVKTDTEPAYRCR